MNLKTASACFYYAFGLTLQQSNCVGAWTGGNKTTLESPIILCEKVSNIPADHIKMHAYQWREQNVTV